jgi:hypothetical protein
MRMRMTRRLFAKRRLGRVVWVMRRMWVGRMGMGIGIRILLRIKPATRMVIGRMFGIEPATWMVIRILFRIEPTSRMRIN